MERIFNTGETDCQLRTKYNPNGSHLHRVQSRMLEMMKYLDGICKDIGVEYRLDGGTFLGAVRHHGFIPWDDDVDIAIDGKKNFKKLKRYLETHPHHQFKLQEDKTDHGFLCFWMTIRDTKSEYIHINKVRDIRDKTRSLRGLQIDIFPFENKRILFLYRIAAKIQRFKQVYLIGKHQKAACLTHNIQKFIIHPLFNFISFLFGNSNYYMHSYGAFWEHRFLKDVIFPYSNYVFEEELFPGAGDYDKYLSQIYTNYMDLPPLDKRDHHQVNIKIWN